MDEKYVFDMNAIIGFIFGQVESEKETEVVDLYNLLEDSNDLILTQKQIRETKEGDTTAKSTIRYDMVRMFIEHIMNADFTEPSFGETIMFNTMLNEGLMKKID